MNSTNGAYNDPSASVWVVKVDGTRRRSSSRQLNAVAGLTNSWARWAPFAQTVGTERDLLDHGVEQRDFGTRLVALRRPQIWMTAFFPIAPRARARIRASAAFRLPFQNIDSNNHIAQWTERIVVTQ